MVARSPWLLLRVVESSFGGCFQVSVPRRLQETTEATVLLDKKAIRDDLVRDQTSECRTGSVLIFSKERPCLYVSS
jgi:hypothetical protein